MPTQTTVGKTSELQKALDVMDKNIQDVLLKENVTPTIIKKILALGEPFKKVMRVLGNDKKTNPILAFVLQKYVQQNLLVNNRLNSQTFKAIYNAVANKYVVDSEFYKANDYNIIYCKDLYTKSPAEMEKYLKLQGKLEASKLKFTDKVYSRATQNENKQVFISTKISDKPVITDRAANIKATSPANFENLNVQEAKLNSIELAEAILGAEQEKTIPLSNVAQDKIVKALDTLAKVYVVIQSLMLHSKSNKAREAIVVYRDKFANLTQEQITASTEWLAKNNVLPREQIQLSDADALIDKVSAHLAKL